jgi:hypothetical protein
MPRRRQDYEQQAHTTIVTRNQPVINPPTGFSFIPAEWPKWKTRFQRYRTASGLSEEPDDKQIDTLIYTLGDKADDIFASFNINDESVLTYEYVLDLFEKHFIPQRNIIFERARFLRRRQNANEELEDFIVDIHSLARTCDWGHLNDEMVLMVLLLGLNDEKLSNRLLLDPDITLMKAITSIRYAETIKQEKDNTSNKNLAIEATERQRGKLIGLNQNQVDNRQASRSFQQKRENQTRCSWCGNEPSHPRSLCPANKVTCNKCKKLGHFSKVCRSKVTNEIEVDIQSGEVSNLSSVSKKFFIGSVGGNSKPWKVEILFEGTPLTFKVDSGADVTVIPPGIVPANKIRSTHVELYGAGSTKLETLGYFKANFRYKDINISHPVYIVKGLVTPLLGRPAIQELKILTFVDSVSNNDSHFFNEYHEMFNGLGVIPDPYTIALKDGAKPYAITTPRSVPLPLMDKVKAELECMVKLKVITPVDHATQWCSGMVVVPKPNGSIRICVDLTKLNESVQRPYHPIPKIETSLSSISGAKLFSKLDANSGFWQVPLNPESQDLTTFLTPFGRFKFLKLPFGITSAPEHFQKCMYKILGNQSNVAVHMDDILIWGKTQEEHDKVVREVLDKLKSVGMTLNREKTEFGKTRIKYLGHYLSSSGISADPQKVSAILDMECPKNVKDLQRFNGMVNFLAKFIPEKAKIMAPINVLLQANVPWSWGPEQQKAFEGIKNLLTKSPCLAVYDVGKKTIISCDASTKGLGSMLSQVQEDGKVRPVSFASRSLLPAEKNYANIEREATAVAWACDKFKEFIIGKRITIQTDHKPLVQILKSKHLDELSPRIQRIRLRLMRYDFEVMYVPGKHLMVADTLSRAPLPFIEQNDYELGDETQAFVQMIVSCIGLNDITILKVLEEQNKDPTLTKLKKILTEEWPPIKEVEPTLKPYHSVKDELSVDNGILLRGTRMIIPPTLQPWALQKIHEGHFGITKCRLRARESVWWPGISSAIEDMVKSCHVCIRHSTNNHEPLLPSQFPDRPWKILAMDLFKLDGVWFFTVTDYYSRYFEIAELQSLTSQEVIMKCKAFFCRHGIPEELRSDSGSQFQILENSDFKNFSNAYGFKHVRSSPKFPQSNGEAEAAVKIAKMILKKNTDDPYLALLAYRTTPLHNGYSPAQLLMNRRLRSTLPQSGCLLREMPDLSKLAEKEDSYRKQYKGRYDQRHRVRSLQPLQIGQPVWIIDLRRHGKVVGISNNPRSYLVETDLRTVTRNRFHLKPLPSQDGSTHPENLIHPHDRSRPKRNLRKPLWLKGFQTSGS